MRSLIIVLFLVLLPHTLFSQEKADTKYWIIFRDKGEFKPGMKVTIGSAAHSAATEIISEKAIQRRKKVLAEDRLFDYKDLPVNSAYLESLSAMGVKTIAESRWLNGASAYLTEVEAGKIRSLPYVSGVKIVQELQRQEIQTAKTLMQDYGKSKKQMQMVNVPRLHDLGINGKGVLIACLDDGFDWRNHESLRNLNVVGEYDFINEDDRAYYEEVQPYKDVRAQGQHGTAVVSTMSGYKEDKLIGPAYGADLLLAKTEYIPSETPMEEDFWLEAAEWAEAKGADIITSSLIYKAYDSPYSRNSYKYGDYNGVTAITTIAATRAAYLGVVVCQAMGNYNQTEVPSLGSAADADSIISVGAVAPDGSPAGFTSNGPTSDGRMKPDVSAPGVMVYAAVVKEVAGDDSTYEYTSGTSFATPITAGICAQILSVHPGLTPLQVREALRSTASKSSDPDNVLGWGIVNAYDAVLYHGMAWSNEATFRKTDNGLEVRTGFASKETIDPSTVKFNYSTDGGATYKSAPMTQSGNTQSLNSGEFSLVAVELGSSEGLMYYFSAETESGKAEKSSVKAGR